MSTDQAGRYLRVSISGSSRLTATSGHAELKGHRVRGQIGTNVLRMIRVVLETKSGISGTVKRH